MNLFNLLIIFLLLSGNNNQLDSEGVLVDRTLVEVEKEAITLSDLETHSRIQIVISEGPESLFKLKDSPFINSMITLLVNREIISIELKKDKKFKPNMYFKDAENLLIKIKSKFKEAGSFENFLKEINQTEAELKRILAIYLMIDDYLNKLADEKVRIDEDEYQKYISQSGITPITDTDTINKYKNELKMEKKKIFISNYIEDLKNRYRIRYLYISQ